MQTVEKWATRSDAWTPDDDKKLASLVLGHIKSGSTQLRAFEEAANELGRTAAACGYRWNGVVRKHYRSEIEDAKRQRKSSQKAGVVSPSPVVQDTTPVVMTSSDSMKDVLKFLQTFDEQYQRMRQQLESVTTERDELAARLRELDAKTVRTPEPTDGPITPQQLQEDSRTLFAIMERARKLLEQDGTKAQAE